MFHKKINKKNVFLLYIRLQKTKDPASGNSFRNGRIRIVFFSDWVLDIFWCCPVVTVRRPCPRLSQNTIWVLFPPGRQFSDKSHNKSLIYIWDKFLKYLFILSQEMCLRIQSLIYSQNLGPFKIFGCLILYEKSIYFSSRTNILKILDFKKELWNLFIYLEQKIVILFYNLAFDLEDILTWYL